MNIATIGHIEPAFYFGAIGGMIATFIIIFTIAWVCEE
jgi:hypothetical protein